MLITMTNDNRTARRGWVGAAVALLGVAVLGRELTRSGTLGGSLVEHWYGEAAFTAVFLTAVGAALYCLHRAYRSRA